MFFFFFLISATEELVIQAQEKGEQHINMTYASLCLAQLWSCFLIWFPMFFFQWVSTHPSSALYSCCVCSHVLWSATLWTGRWRIVKTQSKSMCSETCIVSSDYIWMLDGVIIFSYIINVKTRVIVLSDRLMGLRETVRSKKWPMPWEPLSSPTCCCSLLAASTS